jgi:hypothetical protein
MKINQLVEIIIQNIPGLGETQAKLELFQAEIQFAEETDILRKTAIISANGSAEWVYPSDLIRVHDIEFYDAAVRRLEDLYYKQYSDTGITWEYVPGVDTIRIRYSHLPKTYTAGDHYLETPTQYCMGLAEKVCSKHYRRVERLKEAQFAMVEYREAVLRAKKEVNKWIDQTNSGIRPHYF